MLSDPGRSQEGSLQTLSRELSMNNVVPLVRKKKTEYDFAEIQIQNEENKKRLATERNQNNKNLVDRLVKKWDWLQSAWGRLTHSLGYEGE